MLDFLNSFFDTIGIESADAEILLAHARVLNGVSAWCDLHARLTAGDYEKIADILAEAETIGARYGIHTYTAQLLIYCFAARALKERYRTAGIDEAIYWNSMRDLKWKFQECLDVHGVPGSFVAPWFEGFFCMTRFALGRLQFEHTTFRMEQYSRAGVTLHRGDDVITMHIPSAGPLTWESRLDAYKRAYAFYSDYRAKFPGGVLPLVCHSWLLYPGHSEFLPEHSNIRAFMGDFDIIESDVDPKFGNAWRVFGAAAEKSPEEWPRDTSLRRAFADRIRAGGSVGHGYGVILFDGENILA